MSAQSPTILHVDMDAFFASIELRDRPELAGAAVCVGGSADSRGVIAAASYAARASGVHSAMPTAQALRLCPALVLLPPDFDKYTGESRRIMQIFQRYTPLVEPVSLDEAYLDVAGCERLLGSAESIGRAIKSDILAETGLVASVGIGPSKFIAKLAGELSKPDGFRVVQPHEVRSLLDPLPVERIHGVGERTARRLQQLGVHTVGDLAAQPREQVLRVFGGSGAWIHDLAHGIDSRRVHPLRTEKSHGRERTFAKDIADREELRLSLLEFAQDVAYDLRQRGLRGRTIALKARTGAFETLTRSHTLDLPTNLAPRLYAVARELLERVPRVPLRLLGLSVSNLEDVRAPVQATFFDSDLPPTCARATPGAPGRDPERERRLEQAGPAFDRLRAKYGRGALIPGSLLGRVIAREARPGMMGAAHEAEAGS